LKIQNTYTEPTLIAALQKHDNEAYHYLYSNYRGAMFTIISQFVPDTETANDILQEVFIAVWKNIDKYDPEKGRLFTWLHTLTRNAAINTIRTKNFKSFQKNEQLSDYVSGIELKTAQQQNINLIGLRKQVHQLRAEYKAIVELFYYNGFTQEEVAKILEIPIGTVKTRLRNALIELRKQFK
jgi:RNA polymerase sigma-70 factor (ECF subfamily)